jgi:hypothetical protein
MNLQQIFSKGLAHLRAQGKPAIDENGDCLYRAPDGCKCFIGGLIPDDKYGPHIENGSASKVRNLFDADPDIDGHILNAMQAQLHDAPAQDPDNFMERVEAAAQNFAKQHGLEYRVP